MTYLKYQNIITQTQDFVQHTRIHQLTWYGFPELKIFVAFRSSLILGSPGVNGSTFPVCACALLKLDASTTATLDLDTELARAKPSRKRKRVNIIAMVVRNTTNRAMQTDKKFDGEGTTQIAGNSIRSLCTNDFNADADSSKRYVTEILKYVWWAE